MSEIPCSCNCCIRAYANATLITADRIIKTKSLQSQLAEANKVIKKLMDEDSSFGEAYEMAREYQRKHGK